MFPSKNGVREETYIEIVQMLPKAVVIAVQNQYHPKPNKNYKLEEVSMVVKPNALVYPNTMMVHM